MECSQSIWGPHSPATEIMKGVNRIREGFVWQVGRLFFPLKSRRRSLIGPLVVSQPIPTCALTFQDSNTFPVLTVFVCQLDTSSSYQKERSLP